MSETYPDIKAALGQFGARAAAYRLYQEYYGGQHRLAFATDKFRSAFGTLFRAFSLNLCPKVVDSCANRLSLTGFGAEEGGEQAAAAAWAIWQANRMDLRSGEVHTEALTAGDAYVIVWPDRDGGQPVIYPNDGAAMTVRYDQENPGRILWAAKAWTLEAPDGRLRLNLYYPDRIEKYITRSKADALPDNSNGFEPFEAPGEPWPLENPYGAVPVFHFANRSRTGRFGVSELSDVIPIQDALNKTVADMLVAGEFVALPQRWATGLETDIDEATGKPKAPFIPGADRLWTTEGVETKFGQFEAASLDGFLKEKSDFAKDIGSVSSTPIHFLIPPTGDWPSGESLKTAESEFTAKVKRRQLAFGNVWENVMSFALQVANQGGKGVRLSAMWTDPAPRSERDQADVAVLKSQVGVSDAQLQREMGYTEEEIAQMATEKRAAERELGERLMRSFERGGEPPDGE